MNMGNAWHDQTSGDRRRNTDRTIDCYERAVDILTRESLSVDWVKTQINMGVGLRNRMSGDRRLNIDKDVECHR